MIAASTHYVLPLSLRVRLSLIRLVSVFGIECGAALAVTYSTAILCRIPFVGPLLSLATAAVVIASAFAFGMLSLHSLDDTLNDVLSGKVHREVSSRVRTGTIIMSVFWFGFKNVATLPLRIVSAASKLVLKKFQREAVKQHSVLKRLIAKIMAHLEWQSKCEAIEVRRLLRY